MLYILHVLAFLVLLPCVALASEYKEEGATKSPILKKPWHSNSRWKMQLTQPIWKIGCQRNKNQLASNFFKQQLKLLLSNLKRKWKHHGFLLYSGDCNSRATAAEWQCYWKTLALEKWTNQRNWRERELLKNEYIVVHYHHWRSSGRKRQSSSGGKKRFLAQLSSSVTNTREEFFSF